MDAAVATARESLRTALARSPAGVGSVGGALAHEPAEAVSRALRRLGVSERRVRLGNRAEPGESGVLLQLAAVSP